MSENAAWENLMQARKFRDDQDRQLGNHVRRLHTNMTRDIQVSWAGPELVAAVAADELYKTLWAGWLAGEASEVKP